MARTFALSLAVLVVVFETGTCLQCYQCTSSLQDPTSSKCGKNFTATISVDCKFQDAQMFASHYLKPLGVNMPTLGNNQYCLRTENMQGGFVRSCIYVNSAADLNNFCESSRNLLKSCDYCDKDYCNASNVISSSLPIAFLALVATYFFYKQ